MKLGTTARRGLRALLTATSSAAILAIATSGANALPGRDDISPDDNVDVTNVWAGVGMMYNAGAGTVCTGQLINSRTVIFAAHCTDSFFDNDYGAATGGVPMAFGFGVDALPGFIEWFNNGFQTDESLLVYNVLQVQSVMDADTFDFPGADVVMATLDSPAIGLPTYGMLFSPITESVAVSNVGYGGTGNGTFGPYAGIDWQRRAGTNMLDGLFSQDDFIAATFALAGGEWASLSPQSGSQLLYHIDFDRPDRDDTDCGRGNAPGGPDDYICTSAFGGAPNTGSWTWDGSTFFVGTDNINWFGGGATDRESGTAGGDSGSGLFVEMDGNQLITGVLSGGWGFTSPAGGYGDISYYNPLYLYQNWILAENPMVYASAVEGDGNWSDASHWQQDLDPNYYVLDEEGNAVNGLNGDAPADLIEALFTQENRWGTILDRNVDDITGNQGQEGLEGDTAATASSITAVDNIGHAPIADGKPLTQVQDTLGGTIGLGSQVAETTGKATVQVQDDLVSFVGADSAVAETGIVDASADVPESDGFTLYGEGGSLSLPPLGWVPNNDWGSFGAWTGPGDGTAHFYDVLLGNAGTTTVDMDVELDMFTIANANARLVIPEAYTFNTLIAFNQTVGVVELDGHVNAREYMLTSGVLTGNGSLNTMTLWNVAGGVAPGRIGEIGQFDISGDYVQTAAGSLWIDIGPDGTSDLITIDGDVSLDGLLIVSPVSGYLPTYGDTFTFATTTGDAIGNFAGVSDLPGVLRPVVRYNTGSADLEIVADLFNSQADFSNDFQHRLGAALDAGRDAGSYGALADVYGIVDLLEGEDLETAFTTMAPLEAIMFDRGVRSHNNVLNRALLNQIGSFDGAAGMASNRSLVAEARQSEGLIASNALGQLARAGVKNDHGGDARDSGFRAFSSIGSISGDNMLIDETTMADMEGSYALLGGDMPVGEKFRLGFAAGFAESSNDGRGFINATTSDITSTQFGVFGSFEAHNFHASGSIAFTNHDLDARRTIVVGSGTSMVRSEYSADGTVYDLNLAYNLTPNSDKVRVAPFIGLTGSDMDFDQGANDGPVGALTIAERSYTSLITRWGATIDVDLGRHEIAAYAALANENEDDNDTYVSSFTAAPTVGYAGTTTLDLEDWIELGLSFSRELDMGGTISLSGDLLTGNDAISANSISIEFSMPF